MEYENPHDMLERDEREAYYQDKYRADAEMEVDTTIPTKSTHNLVLERGTNPGFYHATLLEDGWIDIDGCGKSWNEAIDDLLAKINWKYHEKHI